METMKMAQLTAVGEIFRADREQIIRVLGEQLAKTHGYPVEDGKEAVWYHIIQKHNWLPRDVRSLSLDDLELVCASELKAMELTPELNDLRSVLVAAAGTIDIKN